MIKAKCAPYLKHGKPERRSQMVNDDDYTIVRTYVDAVRAGGHPGHDRRSLTTRVGAGGQVRTHPPGDQAGEVDLVGLVASPGPARHTTPNSDHRTPRPQRGQHATIAPDRCPLDSDDGRFDNSHSSRSEGIFTRAAPAKLDVYRWIQA